MSLFDTNEVIRIYAIDATESSINLESCSKLGLQSLVVLHFDNPLFNKLIRFLCV